MIRLGACFAFVSCAAYAAQSLPYRETLDQYCITCHNQRLKTGGLALDTLDVQNVPGDAATWEKVVRKLRAGAMPPASAKHPDKATNHSLVAYLEGKLDAAASAHPNPGDPVLHRMNRAEYANAIRDLLDLEIDASISRSSRSRIAFSYSARFIL